MWRRLFATNNDLWQVTAIAYECIGKANRPRRRSGAEFDTKHHSRLVDSNFASQQPPLAPVGDEHMVHMVCAACGPSKASTKTTAAMLI